MHTFFQGLCFKFFETCFWANDETTKPLQITFFFEFPHDPHLRRRKYTQSTAIESVTESMGVIRRIGADWGTCSGFLKALVAFNSVHLSISPLLSSLSRHPRSEGLEGRGTVCAFGHDWKSGACHLIGARFVLLVYNRMGKTRPPFRLEPFGNLIAALLALRYHCSVQGVWADVCLSFR